MTDGPELDKIESETEEVDAVLVPADEASLPVHASRGPAPARLRETPAVQAVAIAAGGFLAGAAVVGLARRRHAGTGRGRRRLLRSGRAAPGRRPAARAGGAELLQVLGSRSFLLDVHILAPAARQR